MVDFRKLVSCGPVTEFLHYGLNRRITEIPKSCAPVFCSLVGCVLTGCVSAKNCRDLGIL